MGAYRFRTSTGIAGLILTSLILLHGPSNLILDRGEFHEKSSEEGDFEPHLEYGFQDGYSDSTFSVGDGHICWLTTKKFVNCQGDNRFGQLGLTGDQHISSVRSSVPDLSDF